MTEENRAISIKEKKNSTFSRFLKTTALATNINEIKAFLNNS